jgi:hypothetical protein
MIRQRVLTLGAVLALLVSVQIAPLPIRPAAPFAAMAQGTPTATAGTPTDLAVVALQCAEAPSADALATYFASGAPPTGCAHAAGVRVAIEENAKPLSGSPFTADTAGTLGVRVGAGSAVEVREDPKSLPAGYEPLDQEANGVPYANPIRIDSAEAGVAALFVNVPTSVAATLAQGTPVATTGQPIDLAVATLYCTAAPAADALTTFFASGTPPAKCSPAAGVHVAVTENGTPLAGSPFTTDTAGSLGVRVGLGSAVEVREDLKSLPPDYAPLTQEANGVPYANPVRLDAAKAGAAALFVNVPTAVAAALMRTTPVAETSASTGLAVGAMATRGPSSDRTGCDPAYPDARTCIPPGPPLAWPCSITTERNFTVLPPDPRRLDADGDGIGCEPIAPSGGSSSSGTGLQLYSTGGGAPPAARPAAPASSGSLTVDRSYGGIDGGASVSPVTRYRASGQITYGDHDRAGLWFVPYRRPFVNGVYSPTQSGNGNVAVVSNPVFIGNGLWRWPNHTRDGDQFLFGRIAIGNINIASNRGNVAVVSNPVVIGRGLWNWPGNNHGGAWFGTNSIGIGNIDIASGNGNVAAVSNPVFIGNGFFGNGLRRWPDRNHGNTRFGSGFVGIGNIDVASGHGNVAVVSNPVVIGHGLWTWMDNNRDDHWRWPGRLSVGNISIGSGNGNVAVASNPVVILGKGLWSWPGRNHNGDGFWAGSIGIGNISIGSGGGNVAVVSNPVVIGLGLWSVPGHNRGDTWLGSGGIGIGNVTIASSGGNIAVVSNPVVIGGGLWSWDGHDHDGDHNHDGNWSGHDNRDAGVESLSQGATGESGTLADETLAVDDGIAGETPPSKLDQADSSEQPTLSINGELSVAPSSDSSQPASDTAVESPADTVAPSSDSVQPPSGGGALPTDVAVEASDASAQNESGPSPDSASGAPASGDVESGVNPGLDAGVDAATAAPDASSVDAGYVDPSYSQPDAGYVETSAPALDPNAVDTSAPAPDSGYVDPGYVDPSYTQPDPSYIAPDTGYVDAGVAGPVDSGTVDQMPVAPEPGYSAPASGYIDPGYVEPSAPAPDPGYSGSSSNDASYSQPDPGFSAPDAGNAAPVAIAPDSGYVDPGVGPANLPQDSGYGGANATMLDPGSGSPDFAPVNAGPVQPDPGYVDPGAGDGNFQQDAGNVVANAGAVDTGNVAAEPDSGRGGRGRGGRHR